MSAKKESVDILKNGKAVRTTLDCHNCHKDFIAQLDFSLDGNHIVHCPRCGHQHCRVIKEGKVTDDRWDHKQKEVKVSSSLVWVSEGQVTSVASMFLRDRWLNHGS